MQGLDLVFVAAYQHMITVPFVDALLALLKDEFVAIYQPQVYEYKHFDDTYKRLLEKIQKQATASKNRLAGRGGGKASQVLVCTWRVHFWWPVCVHSHSVHQTARWSTTSKMCLLQMHSSRDDLTQSQDSEDSDDTENRGLNDPNIIADRPDNPTREDSSRTAFNTDALARRAKGKAPKPKPAKNTPTKTKGKKVCV